MFNVSLVANDGDAKYINVLLYIIIKDDMQAVFCHKLGTFHNDRKGGKDGKLIKINAFFVGSLYNLLT